MAYFNAMAYSSGSKSDQITYMVKIVQKVSVYTPIELLNYYVN